MNDKTNAATNQTNGAAHDETVAETPEVAASGSMPDPAAGTTAGRFGIRRPRTRAEERIEAIDASPSALAAQVDELRARAETAEQELAETTGLLQRTAADFQNYRRRTEQERAAQLAYATERLLGKLLAIADDFDRAIDHAPSDPAMGAWVEGVTAIDRKIRALLDSEGVTPIESVGQPFDPKLHEAIAHEPTTDAPDGTVLREFQRGYELAGRVLRPALVAVADNTSQPRTDPGVDAAPDSED
jgi:molecular chaperone GrpE